MSVLSAVALIVSVLAPFVAGVQPAAAAPQPGVANVAIGFSANPITANGTAQTTATATVTDATSALPLQNETVTWSSIDTTTAATHDVTFSATTCTTNASGQCSVTITASTTADTETIKASATGVDNGSNTAQLNEIAGPTSVVTLALNPAAIPADGHSRTSATATVKDVNNNPIASTTVNFGTGAGGDVTFVGGTTQCTTGTNGTCSVTIQASTTADVEHINAASGGHSDTKDLTEFTPAGSVTVAVSPASIPADGASTTTATATVKDASNNLENGALVAFSTTNGDVAFPSGNTCTTTSNGTCSVTVRASSTADSETIQGLVGNNPGVAGTTTLTEFKAPAAITLTLAPSSIPADGASESVASVVVKDAATTPAAVTDALVTFTRSGDVTFKNGVASCHTDNTGACSVTIVASSTVDTETITAQVGSATTSQPLLEYAVPNSVAVALSKSNVPADGTTSTATVTVTGTSGPVANAPVTFTKTGNVTFQGNISTCTTNAQGTCPVTLVAPTNAEQDTITATSDGKTGTATLTVYTVPSSVTLSLSPTSVPADSTSISTATVTVQDSTPSAVAGAVVTLAHGAGGDVTFPNGASCTTGADGTCTVQIKASATADTETITATTANNKTASKSLVEYVTPAAVAVSLNPASIAANGTDPSTATITVTSAGSAADVGVPVTVTSPSGDVTFSDGNGGYTSTGSCTTGAGGTCPVTIKASTTADQEHITAITANGKTGSATLTEYGAPANISIALSKTSIKADGVDTTTATMTVTDGNGAAVKAAAVQVSTGSGGDVTFSNGGACTTAADGTCAVTITASHTADQETITAATGASGAVKNSAVLTEYGDPATTTLALNPSAVAVNGTSAATVSVKDSNGLGVANVSASFSVSGSGASFPGSSSCTTLSDGTCSVSVQGAASPGSASVSVTAGGHTDSKTLTVYGAPAAVALTFTGGKTMITADGADWTAAVATVTDSAGNAVPSAAVTFRTDGDVTFSNSGGCATAADGTCSVKLTSSTTAGPEAITASTTNGKTDTKTITEIAGPVATVGLQLSPSTPLVADGMSTATATATVKDAHDNLISGAHVTFTTSGDVTFSNSAACTTDATGTCAVTVTSSTTAGPETITAHDGSVTGTAVLTETAGPATTVTVALSTATVVANGTDTATATATVKDAHGNVVAGAPVTFTTNGDVTFSNGGACTTGTNGTCAITVTASTSPDVETITAHQAALTGTATLTETPNNTVRVVLDPTSLPADGQSVGLAEATVTDGTGHAAPNATVTWTTSGDVEFSDNAQCVTDSTGVCDVLIGSSTTADTETITATVGVVHGSATLTETTPRSGYWLVGQRGDVFGFGDAKWMGNAPVGSANAVDIEGTVTGNGYYVLDTAGHVYRFGDAIWYGDMSLDPGEVAVSMSADPYGDGYWIFTNFGRVQEFGNSGFFGDMDGKPLNAPVVGSVATPSGEGYWMVAADGGIFSFGDARFYGSMGGKPLNAPVVGLVPDPDGVGYWLDASDGGVFAFDAGFRGSMGGKPLNKPVIGMVSYGDGYLMVASDGGVFNFSNKPFSGSLGSNPPSVPIVNIAAIPS